MATAGKLKVLILGANGMLGHKLYQVLSTNSNLDVYGTVRCLFSKISHYGFYNQTTIRQLIFADSVDRGLSPSGVHHWLKDALQEIKPNVIINCFGIL